MAARSWQFKLVLTVGYLEAIALVVYGLTIVWSANTSGSSGAVGSDVSPLVLLASYAAFAAIIAIVTRLLGNGRAGARTPYLLAQAFALVIAQPLVSGSETIEKVIGVVLALAAVSAAVLLLTRAVSAELK